MEQAKYGFGELEADYIEYQQKLEKLQRWINGLETAYPEMKPRLMAGKKLIAQLLEEI